MVVVSELDLEFDVGKTVDGELEPEEETGDRRWTPWLDVGDVIEWPRAELNTRGSTTIPHPPFAPMYTTLNYKNHAHSLFFFLLSSPSFTKPFFIIHSQISNPMETGNSC